MNNDVIGINKKKITFLARLQEGILLNELEEPSLQTFFILNIDFRKLSCVFANIAILEKILNFFDFVSKKKKKIKKTSSHQQNRVCYVK